MQFYMMDEKEMVSSYKEKGGHILLISYDGHTLLIRFTVVADVVDIA